MSRHCSYTSDEEFEMSDRKRYNPKRFVFSKVNLGKNFFVFYELYFLEIKKIAKVFLNSSNANRAKNVTSTVACIEDASGMRDHSVKYTNRSTQQEDKGLPIIDQVL